MLQWVDSGYEKQWYQGLCCHRTPEKKAKSANSFASLKALTDFTKLTLRSLNSIQTVEGTFIGNLP